MIFKKDAAMKIAAATALFGLATVSLSASAQDDMSRLAYSKKDKVEVFAKKQGSEWCHENVQLVFIGDQGANLDTNGLQPLVKKLSKLLPRSCSSMNSVSLSARFKQGDVVYAATASSANNWTLVQQSVQAETPAEQAEPAIIESAKTDQKKQVENPAAVTNKPAPASTDFTINGWKPVKNGKGVLFANESAEEYPTPATADGCKLNLEHSSSDRQLQSSGLSCKEGYLSGTGKIAILNDRGRVADSFKATVRNGFPLDARLPKSLLPQVLVGQEGYYASKSLYSYFGTDAANQAHYLTGLSFGRWDNFWSATRTSFPISSRYTQHMQEILIVVKNPEIAEQPQQRQKLLDNARKTAFKTFGKNSYRFRLVSGLPKLQNWESLDYFTQVETDPYGSSYQDDDGLKAKDKSDNTSYIDDIRLWDISYVYNTRGIKNGFKSESVTNHIEERKLVAQRNRKQKLQDMANTYNSLKGESVVDIIEYKYGRLDNLAEYNLGRMALNESDRSVKAVIKTDDTDNSTATTQWPFLTHLTTGEELDSDSWYIIAGDLTGDTSVRDDKGLIIPQIAVKDAVKCSEDACKEYQDVVQVIRDVYGEPDWNPADSGQN